MKRLAIALIAAFSFSLTSPALAAGPDFPPAPHKPLPVGAVVKYDSWSYKVLSSGDDGVKIMTSFKGRKFTQHSGLLLEGFNGFLEGYFFKIEDDERAKLKSLFPLKVGNSVRVDYLIDVDPAGSVFSVVSTETVQLVAGAYDTFVILEKGLMQTDDKFGDVTWNRRLWYAPALGTVVRASSNIDAPTGSCSVCLMDFFLPKKYELTQFSLPGSAVASRAVPAQMDRTPPSISVSRIIETQQAVAVIPGRLKDGSKIIELSVDGGPVSFAADGTFKIRRGVPIGDSELKLAAVDEWGNRSEIVVHVKRRVLMGSMSKARKGKGGAKTDPPLIDFNFGKYYALVIGSNKYKHLPNLKTAVADAQEVAAVLHGKYGFNVELLLNATRSDILKTLYRLRRDLTTSDNLLIYYAGHGYLDELAGRGYWLPVDSAEDDPSNWISNSDLTDALRASFARHVLLVADSCFSGTLLRKAPLRQPIDSVVSLKRLSLKKSRTVLTSGGVEPVVDQGANGHSVFANAFLEALRENVKVIDGQQLFSSLRRNVMVNAEQVPEYSDVRNAGHDGGDFMFVPR